VVESIRDFGLFYGVIGPDFDPTIRPIPLSVGIVAAVGGVFTARSQRRQLRKVVDHHNYLNSFDIKN
jgi:hypothetical protein